MHIRPAVSVVALAFSLACRAEAPSSPPAPTEFELNELSVAQLQDGMSAGRYTSRRLVELYLQRIAQIDAAGPRLRSVIETNPDALTIADALDAERKAKGPRGPLHGIPIVIKDNIDTGDKMLTTAGSLALVGAPAPRDAFVVERLRAAGVVILGKTNLSEWANIRSTTIHEWLERARRPGEEPLRPRSQPVRVEFGDRRSDRRQPRGRRCRHRDGRVSRLPFVSQRARWHQAHHRTRQPHGDHSDRAFAGHGRADGANRGRRRGVAERDGRR